MKMYCVLSILFATFASFASAQTGRNRDLLRDQFEHGVAEELNYKHDIEGLTSLECYRLEKPAAAFAYSLFGASDRFIMVGPLENLESCSDQAYLVGAIDGLQVGGTDFFPPHSTLEDKSMVNGWVGSFEQTLTHIKKVKDVGIIVTNAVYDYCIAKDHVPLNQSCEYK